MNLSTPGSGTLFAGAAGRPRDARADVRGDGTHDARARRRLQVVDGASRAACNRSMKLVRRLLLVGLALAALAVGALFLGLDAAVRKAVERGGTTALGVPTRLAGASLSPFSGELSLAGLEIENPPGFEDEPFLALQRAHTEVALSSLREDVVRIELVELEHVDLLLQRRGGKSNYGVILDHLGSGGKEEEPAEGDGVRVNIERLVIRDIRADFDLLPLGGEVTRAQVTIPELVLEDLGNSGDGASMAEVTARVVKALLQATLQAGGKVLSPELLTDLAQGLGALGVRTIDLGEGVLGTLGEGAGKVIQGLGDVLEGRKKD